MAVDKLVDSTQLNADLTSVANAIRTKGGTSAQLAFPSGFVSAVQAIPTGGGGGSDESGSFIASNSQSNVTVSVTSLHSHLLVWDSQIDGDDDISSAPFGTKKMVMIYADNDMGFMARNAINSAGTAYTAEYSGMGRWGGNTAWNNYVQFSESQMKIVNPRVSGIAYPFIDGHVINWRAW